MPGYNITKVDRISVIKSIFLKFINLNRGRTPGYTVDDFYTDIVNVPWKKIFNFDFEFQVDFNIAVIEFIKEDDYFGTADEVIITHELFYYAETLVDEKDNKVKGDKQ